MSTQKKHNTRNEDAKLSSVGVTGPISFINVRDVEGPEIHCVLVVMCIMCTGYYENVFDSHAGHHVQINVLSRLETLYACKARQKKPTCVAHACLTLAFENDSELKKTKGGAQFAQTKLQDESKPA